VPSVQGVALRLVAVTYDAHDPARLADFWAGVLDRDVVDDGGGLLVPGAETQLGLRFVRSDSMRVGRHRMHIHVTSEGTEQQAVVDRLLAAGATHLDVGQRPGERHVVLADPEGYELCVINPDNDFLRGCGPLGEMACDGSRVVGLFWSEALGWPLVWDEGEETAVQSPLGGTKVSWGGESDLPRDGHRRQRFHLVADDVEAEADRLAGLGAARDRDADSLRDPDGNEFAVVAG
jgi:hypothetical protein